MKNVNYNLDKIIRICINDRILNNNFKYFTEKKFLKLIIRRGGWYQKVLSWELLSYNELNELKNNYLSD